ncbi:hypothetical protein [Capnocytophaga canis]|uniref:hypothetical protein n=1 Tax=Capnocytophaga canis TaxID=1848903 RepID=UPI0037D1FCFA
MVKVSDISKIPIDTSINGEDYLLGTDSDSNLKTKSFKIKDLITFIATHISGGGNILDESLRNAINELKAEIQALKVILQSDDTDLDELQEIVNYIKQNKHILSVLSINNIAGLEEALNNKANVNHTHSYNDLTDKPTNFLEKGDYSGTGKDLSDAIDTKVDKEEGKSLSSNDFTNHYKQKLDSLQNVDISGKLDKGTYTGNAKDLENLINTKVTKEPGKSLISDSEKADILANKNKRVVDFTITGDVDKIFTLIYNDGSTKAKNFTDIVGQASADVMLNSLNFNKDTGVLTGVRSDGRQITVDLNGRFALLNHTHAWNDITGKPATFPPSPHTHVVNWNDVQNKPDLSQLGAKPIIKVTVDTPSATKDKIGTTTSGNYVPKEGDELVVEFTEGTWVNSPTLDIDGSGAKNIMLSGRNPDRNNLSIGNTGQDKTVRLWYDGTNYQLYGATINTTYGIIPQQALENENNNYSYLISGAVVAWIRNWANIIGKPFKLIGNVLNAVNPTNENELIPIKAKGFKTDGGTNNEVLLANGTVANLGTNKHATISTKGLDPNKYYLCTFQLRSDVRYRFIFMNALYGNKPVWATQHDNGFSLYYEFEVTGDGWGTINNDLKERLFNFSWVSESPISSTSQMTKSSNQYVYLRGDAIYHVNYENTKGFLVEFILHNTPGDFTASYESIPKIVDSITTPNTNNYYNRRDLLVFKGVDVTGNDWTAHGWISSNTIFLKGGGNKTIRLHQLENHTIMSFKKCYDSGTITFVCQGKTIVMRGADAFNGADGSNAVISIVNNKCYIDINNYE